MDARIVFSVDPIKRCNDVDRAIRNKVIRIAISKAASPVKAAVISNAPTGRGYLAKSIRIKIGNYNRGLNWVAVVGASKKFKRGGGKRQPIPIFPAKYARLIETGTRFRKATPYLRPALQSTANVYIQTLCRAVEEQLRSVLSGK